MNIFALFITTLFGCQKSVRPVRTSIPHDWVHQPPSNCGVGHCELSLVDSDFEASIEIATEYAQIHLAEKLSERKLTVNETGFIPLTDEMLAMEYQLELEHLVVQEAVHVYSEHGVDSMYVLVCTEDNLPE